MEFVHRPRLVAALLAGGTVVLLGGGAVAATSSASHPENHPDTQVALNLIPMADAGQASGTIGPTNVGSTPSTTTPLSPPTKPAIRLGAATAKQAGAEDAVTAPKVTAATYVVRPGDTLSTIATWFKLHGFRNLYAANAAVIGSDPDVIRPGERISVRSGTMSLQSPA